MSTETTPTPPRTALELTPEDTTGERGEVVSGEPESLECVCGNCSVFEGLISSTHEGIAYHFHETPRPEALAAWPEDQAELHTLCPVCGRVYRDATIRETNTAPVVRVVDLADGSPAKNALLAHDAEMNPQLPPVDRLYINDNGNMACAEHGGRYLADSITRSPRAKLHRTPLGTWERFSGPKAKAELKGAGCDACGATL